MKFNNKKRGEIKMINLAMLNKKIKDSGMTIVAISAKSGILRETLYNKINGNVDFKASEILSLSKVLRLSNSERDKIFFANESESDSTNGKSNNAS
ncbi:MAG: XRE family transcriptional regulator [Firmicutes bacterium]|nr:XRE family transcriptional regulator [Bacillota bacterium]